MHNHSNDNEFNLPVNDVSFSHERRDAKTRFENEAEVMQIWPVGTSLP